MVHVHGLRNRFWDEHDQSGGVSASPFKAIILVMGLALKSLKLKVLIHNDNLLDLYSYQFLCISIEDYPGTFEDLSMTSIYERGSYVLKAVSKKSIYSSCKKTAKEHQMGKR